MVIMFTPEEGLRDLERRLAADPDVARRRDWAQQSIEENRLRRQGPQIKEHLRNLCHKVDHDDDVEFLMQAVELITLLERDGARALKYMRAVSDIRRQLGDAVEQLGREARKARRPHGANDAS